MPSRIKYIRGWEPGGEGLSLRAPSLFISEACEGAEKHPLPASGHQQKTEKQGWSPRDATDAVPTGETGGQRTSAFPRKAN